MKKECVSQAVILILGFGEMGIAYNYWTYMDDYVKFHPNLYKSWRSHSLFIIQRDIYACIIKLYQNILLSIIELPD